MTVMTRYSLALLLALKLTFTFGFDTPNLSQLSRSNSFSSKRDMGSTVVYEPTAREQQYGSDVGRYLLDLHDQKATFNFCGGLFFQLVLTEKLREHLSEHPPHVSKEARMCDLPGYRQEHRADSTRVFHGREIRNVPNAQGGMGLVLQLSYHQDDPQGWTSTERDEYNGWKHDVGRKWRNAEELQQLGFDNFQSLYGKDSYTLHHRFYLRYDKAGRLWLSAEDGCEGTPEAPRQS